MSGNDIGLMSHLMRRAGFGATRKELEAVMDTKIFLDLNVEVDPHWVSKYL